MGILPFTMAFVLKATTKHMRRSVDISIRKTHARWKDFAETDEVKSKEVMQTLMVLHELRKVLDDFQSTNLEYFKDKSDDQAD